MRISSAPERSAVHHPPAGNDVVIFCKLFSDTVTEDLCMLRRKELQEQGEFSCRGCIMDMLMLQQYAFLKSIVLSAWIDTRSEGGTHRNMPGTDDDQRFL